jgi:hypothetical protein
MTYLNRSKMQRFLTVFTLDRPIKTFFLQVFCQKITFNFCWTLSVNTYYHGVITYVDMSLQEKRNVISLTVIVIGHTWIYAEIVEQFCNNCRTGASK